MIVISFQGMGGELDRREVKTEDQAKAALIEMIEAVDHLRSGDKVVVSGEEDE